MGRVAQRLEHSPYTRRVRGSNLRMTIGTAKQLSKQRLAEGRRRKPCTGRHGSDTTTLSLDACVAVSPFRCIAFMTALDILYFPLAVVTLPAWAGKKRAGWPERFGKGEALPP